MQSNKDYDRESYVLIIDDDDTLLKFFKIHLNKFFSKVIVVRNAQEALATLKEKEVDLVISDIRMPKIDGIQLLRKIRRGHPSVPVYLISGALLDDSKMKTIDRHADGFLRKPFSIDDLHSMIQLGMVKRQKLKDLGELITDTEQLRNILNGRASVNKFLVDASKQSEAKELITELRKAS